MRAPRGVQLCRLFSVLTAVFEFLVVFQSRPQAQVVVIQVAPASVMVVEVVVKAFSVALEGLFSVV